jgi:hypothetical protein
MPLLPPDNPNRSREQFNGRAHSQRVFYLTISTVPRSFQGIIIMRFTNQHPYVCFSENLESELRLQTESILGYVDGDLLSCKYLRIANNNT